MNAGKVGLGNDDAPVEIVNIFQGSEVEMPLRYRPEPLPKALT